MRLYLTLRDDLQAFLWILGVVISLGTLALGFALQALIHDSDTDDAQSQVSQAVWVYGLYYTALLALSYGPAHVALLSVGRSIRDTIVGGTPIGKAEVEDWLRRRQELDGLLQLGQNPVSNIKAATLVVSPLLGILLGAFVKQ
ncbi:hypothetical protein [Nocardia lijiangensis]|uniref:hypothetical protein n=1 Tax=Nocardia lijiangensis TaxID=299618 RepID=UPI0009FF30C9|nr:hypothetical protein [Nocardia lijiangensis]